jgi:hypothetical protein
MRLADLEQQIGLYNEAIAGLNTCLEVMGCDRQKLPLLVLELAGGGDRVGHQTALY